MSALEVSPFHGIALHMSTFTYLLIDLLCRKCGVQFTVSITVLIHLPHCASSPRHWPSRLNRPIQAGSQ